MATRGKGRGGCPEAQNLILDDDDSRKECAFRLADSPTSTGMSRRRFTEDAEQVRRRLPHLVPAWTLEDDEEIVGEFKLVSSPVRQSMPPPPLQKFADSAAGNTGAFVLGGEPIPCYDKLAWEKANSPSPSFQEPAPELSPDHKPKQHLGGINLGPITVV